MAYTIEQTEKFFSALGEYSRIRILNLLYDGFAQHATITDTLGFSKTRVTNHLQTLINAGIVVEIRDAVNRQRRLYKVAEPAKGLIQLLFKGYIADPQLIADRKELSQLLTYRERETVDYLPDDARNIKRVLVELIVEWRTVKCQFLANGLDEQVIDIRLDLV